MQTHVAITSSVYLKNNTLKEGQQQFWEVFEAFFPCSGKKNNQKAVSHSNQFWFPNSRAGTQTICLHQVLREIVFWDKVAWISNKKVSYLLSYFGWSRCSGQVVPELGSALIHNKPVNAAAAASPDVTPESLCSSTVYFPLGIARGKRNWWELRHLMAMKLQKW